jgi:hypothetical protein
MTLDPFAQKLGPANEAISSPRSPQAIQSPFLKSPFLGPRGAPGLKPPCKRQRLRPRRAGHWHERPARVFAPHREARWRFASRVHSGGDRLIIARRLGYPRRRPIIAAVLSWLRGDRFAAALRSLLRALSRLGRALSGARTCQYRPGVKRKIRGLPPRMSDITEQQGRRSQQYSHPQQPTSTWSRSLLSAARHSNSFGPPSRDTLKKRNAREWCWFPLGATQPLPLQSTDAASRSAAMALAGEPESRFRSRNSEAICTPIVNEGQQHGGGSRRLGTKSRRSSSWT